MGRFMTDHTGRPLKRTTIRAQNAAAQDAKLSRSTAFKPRPRLDKDQRGMSDAAILVHRVRTHRHWTQERLAAELGVNRSTITRWEAGLITPPTLYETALSDLLKAG